MLNVNSNSLPAPLLGAYVGGGYTVKAAMPSSMGNQNGFPIFAVACEDKDGNAVSWMAGFQPITVCANMAHENVVPMLYGACAECEKLGTKPMEESRYDVIVYWGHYKRGNLTVVIDGESIVMTPIQRAIIDMVKRSCMVRADYLTEVTEEV